LASLSVIIGNILGNSQEEVLAAERARHKEDDRNVVVRLSELQITQTTELMHIMLAKQQGMISSRDATRIAIVAGHPTSTV